MHSIRSVNHYSWGILSLVKAETIGVAREGSGVRVTPLSLIKRHFGSETRIE